MWYCVIGTDNENSLQKRLATRAQHLARLEALNKENRLLLAGPFPAIDTENPGEAGFSGSLIIAAFPSLKEAQEWAEKEPYLSAGVYSKVEVKPFKKVLP